MADHNASERIHFTRNGITIAASAAGALVAAGGVVWLGKKLPHHVGTPSHLESVANKYTDPIEMIESELPEEKVAVGWFRRVAAASLLLPEDTRTDRIRSVLREHKRISDWDPTSLALKLLAQKGALNGTYTETEGELWTPTPLLRDSGALVRAKPAINLFYAVDDLRKTLQTPDDIYYKESFPSDVPSY